MRARIVRKAIKIGEATPVFRKRESLINICVSKEFNKPVRKKTIYDLFK